MGGVDRGRGVLRRLWEEERVRILMRALFMEVIGAWPGGGVGVGVGAAGVEGTEGLEGILLRLESKM